MSFFLLSEKQKNDIIMRLWYPNMYIKYIVYFKMSISMYLKIDLFYFLLAVHLKC